MRRMAAGIGLAALWALLAIANVADAGRPIHLLLYFDHYCDGLDVRLFDRGPVTGHHIGCTGGEFVSGQRFQLEGEEGFNVEYTDQLAKQRYRVEVFQVGYRANRFYVYNARNNLLVRYGTWTAVP